MPELTVFINVFFRNEKIIADYYNSVRGLIGPHRPVFLINNVTEDFEVGQLSDLGEVVSVDEVLAANSLVGADKLLSSRNSRYVRHFFAGVAHCGTDFFTFFDPDNECTDFGWIDQAKRYLQSHPFVIAGSPYWLSSSPPTGDFFDTGFSDQLFVGSTNSFKRFDYSIDSFYSWRYPLRQNGGTFESAVFSNMLTKNLRRVVLRKHSYVHLNEGHSYAKRELFVDVKRFLARMAWNLRCKIVRDVSYE